MNIKGNSITLRAIEERDLPLFNKWANDPDIQDMLSWIHFPSSMDFHKLWFEKLKNDHLNQKWAIEAPGSVLIGMVQLTHIDWRNGTAHHGIDIGDTTHKGKGYGVDALMASMRYAFDEMRLMKLNGWRIEFNVVSKSFYAKCGWKDEGLLRSQLFRKGRRWDQIPIGITRLDYDELITKNKYWDGPNG
jgi:RimJ/RimL family protein N-acetyltransferase